MRARTCLAALLVPLLAGCGGGPALGPEQVDPWPFSVGGGTVTCARGISAAKIGLKVGGKEYALSTNAWADTKQYARIAPVYNGDKAALIKVMEKAREACDVKYGGSLDYEADTIIQP